jgi:type II pantothenate kinase
MKAAIDLGLTNIDTVIETPTGLVFERIPTTTQPPIEQVETVLSRFPSIPQNCAVTGGRYRSLPEQCGRTRMVKINEVNAIGLGGLTLGRQSLPGIDQALVVSAGSGTAMVAARQSGCIHITGSAVGGGTLQGLSRLLLDTTDALEIDRLALQGDANRVDLTLTEAVGGAVGTLPANANAVNFGRLARHVDGYTRADVAAGLVRLVGQVIAVIAINAAREQELEHIVIIGHLADLPSVRNVLAEVAGYYRAKITVPGAPGTGTVLGALLALS